MTWVLLDILVNLGKSVHVADEFYVKIVLKFCFLPHVSNLGGKWLRYWNLVPTSQEHCGSVSKLSYSSFCLMKSVSDVSIVYFNSGTNYILQLPISVWFFLILSVCLHFYYCHA